jgi:choline dehydrogenase-like flavoprotein
VPAADSVIVVGSGPAGVAAASALANRGVAVTILDAGRLPPDGAAALVAPLAGAEPGSWPPGAADALRAATYAATRRQAEAAGESAGVDTVNRSLKPVFGSLFPYSLDGPAFGPTGRGVSLYPSLVRGGLSTAWGGAMLPFGDDDMAGWPLALSDLVEPYREVLRYVPIVGEHDALAEVAPTYAEALGNLPVTGQMRAFLDDLATGASRLRSAGACAGRSRLAVWTGEESPRRCRLAGLCLHGCPYGSIWSASQRLDQLIAAGVKYEPGTVVQRVEERGQTVRLHLGSESGEPTGTRDTARVLLACGPLASTRIVLASTERREAVLRDSQLLAVPLLRGKGARVSVPGSGNTLAQAFLELRDPAVSSGTVHMQFYGFNDLMLAEAATMARLPRARAERLLAPVLGRLLFAQAYLHSAESGAIRIVLDDAGRASLSAMENPDTDAVAKRVLRRLVRLTGATRAMPLLPLASRGLIGTGNHAGGSIPMRRRPGAGESDLLGRPTGFERVHVVDSSVFPTIPSPTITLSVMANATRIAGEIAG